MSTALNKMHKMLPAGKPGERFRNRYHQHQKSKDRGFGGMILRLILLGASLVIGVVLIFIPGPAVVFFLIAGALLAADWLAVARLLDWSEVRIRRLWARAKKIWDGLSTPARVALAIVGAVLGAATAFGFYQLMR